VDKLIDVLVSNGPMGVVAGVMFYLLLVEKKEHRETRVALADIYSKYEVVAERSIEAMSRVTMLIGERLPNRNQGQGG
jgi:hypothetical protein